MITIRAAAVALAAVAPAAAQWHNYPTPGIPRLANGKPNLGAPAPRAADGRPDLSGLWEHKNSRTTAYYLDNIEIPWRPWAAALYQRNTENNQKDNPESRCLPRGVPKAEAFDLHKIVQTPALVVILYEYNTSFRQIFLDGRKLPPDPNPAWMGYSVGRWDGDRLVVEASGFNGLTWLSGRGVPVSDALRVTERFRRRDFGHMEIEITIDDPKAYSRPWTAHLRPELVADTELIEMICNENEKDLPHLVGK
jgi:hypothetical protein